MPDPISSGIQAAANVAQIVMGAVNSGKTKKIAKELEKTRPKYEISELAGQDLSLAESEFASGGLSSTAENAYNSLNNKQFSASLGALLRGGGSVNNVADVYGNSEEGRTRLALLSDQMRLSKISNLMRSREMYREQEDKEFQINKFAPWKDKQVANNQARQQAQNQLWGGISGLASAGMNYFGQKYNEGRYDDALGGARGGGAGVGGMVPQTQFGRPNMGDVNSTYQFNPYQSPQFNPNARNYVQQRPEIDFSYNPIF